MAETREKLVELIARAKRTMWGKNGLSSELARNHYMAEQLIANGVTIPVRCKDCKHCKKYRNRLDPMRNHQLCVRMDKYAFGVEEDDFCSYGERRTDNG
jgi:hypothetical protein